MLLLLELVSFGLIAVGTLLKGVTMVSKLSGKTKKYKQDKKALEEKKQKRIEAKK